LNVKCSLYLCDILARNPKLFRWDLFRQASIFKLVWIGTKHINQPVSLKDVRIVTPYWFCMCVCMYAVTFPGPP
jgi:hypothetical protein